MTPSNDNNAKENSIHYHLWPIFSDGHLKERLWSIPPPKDLFAVAITKITLQKYHLKNILLSNLIELSLSIINGNPMKNCL